MLELWAVAGPWVYPIGVIGLCLSGAIVQAVRRAWLGDDPAALRAPHQAVVGWGILAVVVGLLGSVVGVARVAAYVGLSAGASAEELADMLSVTLSGAVVLSAPLALGLGLLTVAVVAWLGVHYVQQLRGAPESE